MKVLEGDLLRHWLQALNILVNGNQTISDARINPIVSESKLRANMSTAMLGTKLSEATSIER